jgi:transcriptional regulator with XRE-family HTH domain
MKIGDKIYKLRKENNLSQEELANKLNVSRQTVSKWELGDSCPDFDKIVPLCDIFNISTEELLRGKDVDKTDSKKEVVNSNNNQVVKSIISIISIITTIIYLYVSFVTSRWDITWLIWLIYACIVEIVKLIFRLLGGTIDEK